MFTVALLSQKGGAGKTTLACGLAVESERAGLATVVVDLDPQASAAKWADLRQATTPVVTSAHAMRLTPVLTAAQDAGARVAFIDTAPHAADSALMAAAWSESVKRSTSTPPCGAMRWSVKIRFSCWVWNEAKEP